MPSFNLKLQSKHRKGTYDSYIGKKRSVDRNYHLKKPRHWIYLTKTSQFKALFLGFCFLFLTHCKTCEILAPQQWIEPLPPAVEMWSLNHWTTREVPNQDFKSNVLNMLKELKETMSKELNASVRMMFHQIENISKVMKCMKRKINRKSKVEKYNNWNLKIY